MSTTNIMICAGEASGDLHASNLVSAFKMQRKDVTFWGMGGVRLAATGCELRVNCKDLGFIGYVDVILNYRYIMKQLKHLQTVMQQRRPALVILVDYPGFNMRLAKTAKDLGLPVLYYVSPQVWAWKPERIHEIAKRVDMMAVLFPFEVPIYEKAGIPVRFVGNPLVDEAQSSGTKTELRTKFGIDSERLCVGLLPGSRQGEIKRILPVMLKSCQLLAQEHAGLHFLLPVADTLSYDEIVLKAQISGLNIKVVKGQAYDVMQAADAVICSSGTATLETGLIGTPMVVVYKVGWINYKIMKRLITVEDIGLVNIVAGKRVVEEFIQDQAKPELIAAEISRILTDTNYQKKIRCELEQLRLSLGSAGGSQQVAELALEMLAKVETG